MIGLPFLLLLPAVAAAQVWADPAPDGPKSGKVEFVPLGTGSSPHGVVAAAGREGEVWTPESGADKIVVYRYK